MRTAEQVRADQRNRLHKLSEADIERIEGLITNHLQKVNANTWIDIELHEESKTLTIEKLVKLGYKIKEEAIDPREPATVNYTRISWGT